MTTKCTAPGCPFTATTLVTGRDYDGTGFTESCCDAHADYLSEHDGDDTPVNVAPLRRDP